MLGEISRETQDCFTQLFREKSKEKTNKDRFFFCFGGWRRKQNRDRSHRAVTYGGDSMPSERHFLGDLGPTGRLWGLFSGRSYDIMNCRVVRGRRRLRGQC